MDKTNLKDTIISDEEEREQQIHELIRGKRSLNMNIELSKNSTFGEKMADRMASFAGSWPFLGFFAIVVLVWMLVNTKLILSRPFDPYPFVFLNLILACIASIQAPVIMMSQNRESQKDRLRSENDYLINLKSEIILEDLHMKIDEVIHDQKLLKKALEDIKMEMDKNAAEAPLRSDLDGKGDTGGEEPGLYS